MWSRHLLRFIVLTSLVLTKVRPRLLPTRATSRIDYLSGLGQRNGLRSEAHESERKIEDVLARRAHWPSYLPRVRFGACRNFTRSIEVVGILSKN